MSSYDLLHGDNSVYLKHYGSKGMQWGVRKDPATSSDRAKARSDKATADKKRAEAKAKAAGGGGTAAALNKSSEATLAGAKTSEEIYSSAFTAALGDPPITKEKILAAEKAAEKAVAEADGEDGGKGKGEEEKKKGGAGPADPAAEEALKKKKEEEKRQKIAEDRAKAAEAATAVVESMASELSGGKPRSSESLAAEAEGIVSMLKMVAHDKKAYEMLQSIGSRSNSESKGGKRRSTEQLKADSAYVKKISERFTEEADFIGNFGKKESKKESSKSGKKEEDKVKHEKQEWQMSYDLLHGDDSVYLSHYGTKGMMWGVRKQAKRAGSAVKNQMIKDHNKAVKKDAAFLRRIGMHDSAKAVEANTSVFSPFRPGATQVAKVAGKTFIADPGKIKSNIKGAKAAVTKMQSAAKKRIQAGIHKRQDKISKTIKKEAKEVRDYAKSLDKKAKGFESDAKAFEAGQKKSFGKVDTAVNKVGAASARKMADRTRKQAKEQHEAADGLDYEAKEWDAATKANRAVEHSAYFAEDASMFNYLEHGKAVVIDILSENV